MVDKKLQYLLEFPDEDFKKELKTVSALEGISMKAFMIRAIKNEIKKVQDKLWEEN